MAFTDEERDRRHEDVVRRFPGGLSWEQYVFCVLESARDDDDLVDPPSVVGTTFDHFSRMMRLFMDGLVDHRDSYHKPIRWRITKKGRAVLVDMKQEHPEWARPESAALAKTEATDGQA